MRTAACFIKTLKENLRDWKILILAIVFAPFFIYLMYFYLGDSELVTYDVVLVSYDKNDLFRNELVKELKELKTEEGNLVLNLEMASDTLMAKELIKNKDADLLIIIPEGFSDSLVQYIEGRTDIPPAIKNYGDKANTRFMIAASLVDYSFFSYMSRETGFEMPVSIEYEYAGRGKSLNEFDLYVPAMLVLSIIMMLFTAGASVVREVENDTLTRLSLSKLKSGEFLTAMSLNQIIIGLICLLITFLAALSVGYRTSGSVPLLLLTGALTCFAVIAISIITSCFIRTMFGLLTLGCFPFFIMMFFSDCFLPLPKIDLISVAGHQFYLNDLLPTATATRAFNKILNYNSGISDVSFELLWILALSFTYFFIGVRLFKVKYKY